jgi:hypothetical protein
MKKLSLLILSLALSSCQSYRTHFDCPPGKGVPCASLSEIERMVVETEGGPDIFMYREPGCGCDKTLRVWVPECGGRYLYLNAEGCSYDECP